MLGCSPLVVGMTTVIPWSLQITITNTAERILLRVKRLVDVFFCEKIEAVMAITV